MSAAVLEMLERGGPAMVAIFLVTAALWCLILERLVFLLLVFPGRAGSLAGRWRARRERSSWRSRQIRRLELARARAQLVEGVGPARALVGLLPLLGLLGTVLGMIEVFDMMAGLGGGTPRALAGGISQAVLSTFGGLLSAIVGMPALRAVERLGERRVRELRGALVIA